MSRILYKVDAVDVRLPAADGPRPILKDVSFDVRDGEIIGIVGPSGAGKTTLLRVLGGLLEASCGTVIFDGEVVRHPPSGAVMVFQDYGNALLPWRTVARNTALGLEGRVGRVERRRRVAHALRMVGLEDRGADYPWRLSGGMAQRVQIARALALEPKVLLMDEPFGALDAITKASLQDVLLDVQRETDATVVFITHDLDEAIYLSDRVLVISGGPGAIALTVADGIAPAPRSIGDPGTAPLSAGPAPAWTGPASRGWLAGHGVNLSGLLVPLAAIAAWQLLKSTKLLPYEYLPLPIDVVAALVVLVKTGELAADLGHTLGVALLAAGITLTLGGILGLAIGLIPAVRRYTMTSIDFLRTIPAVALVPVAVLTLGPAVTTELILAVYAALWPIVLNTAGGVAAVHPRQYDVARILHFPSVTTVRKIVIPAAVPAWLVGARLAAVIGLLVAIVAEMIMYPRGLGGGLIESLNALAPARMWAYALVCGVVGFLLNAGLRRTVRLALPGSTAIPAAT